MFFVVLLAGCVASVEGEQMGMAKQEVRRGPIGGVEEDEGRGQGRGRLRRETLVRAVQTLRRRVAVSGVSIRAVLRVEY